MKQEKKNDGQHDPHNSEVPRTRYLVPGIPYCKQEVFTWYLIPDNPYDFLILLVIPFVVFALFLCPSPSAEETQIRGH